jgi:hypothetical protein
LFLPLRSSRFAQEDGVKAGYSSGSQSFSRKKQNQNIPEEGLHVAVSNWLLDFNASLPEYSDSAPILAQNQNILKQKKTIRKRWGITDDQ